MQPITLFTMAFAGLTLSEEALALCADVKLALRRANLDIGEAAISIKAPLPKLSAQLNGREPFTLLWRMVVLGPAFLRELNRIRGERLGQIVVDHEDVTRLIRSVEHMEKRMVRMALTDDAQEQKRA